MSTTKARRFDFYPDDWLAGTVELTAADRGVFITICALIYSRGKRINSTLVAQHTALHGNALNASLNRLLHRSKITRNGEEIGQKRCENELKKARKRVGKAAQNARKRWDNTSKNNDIAGDAACAVALLSSNASRASPSPSPSPLRKKERESARDAPASLGSLSQDLKDEWIAEARSARTDSDLPATNLKAEMAKYLAVKREPERGDFVRWALNARANGVADLDHEEAKRDRPTGPPPPLKMSH